VTEEESETPDIDEQITTSFTELMDLQHKIVMFSRDMSQRAVVLAEAFEAQAAKAREIAELHEEGTQLAARIFGDIIVAEQGFEAEEEEDDDRDDS
jgi:hypothetical protein